MRVPRGIGLVFMIVIGLALVAGLTLVIVLVTRTKDSTAYNIGRVITVGFCNSKSEPNSKALRWKRDATSINNNCNFAENQQQALNFVKSSFSNTSFIIMVYSDSASMSVVLTKEQALEKIKNTQIDGSEKINQSLAISSYTWRKYENSDFVYITPCDNSNLNDMSAVQKALENIAAPYVIVSNSMSEESMRTWFADNKYIAANGTDVTSEINNKLNNVVPVFTTSIIPSTIQTTTVDWRTSTQEEQLSSSLSTFSNSPSQSSTARSQSTKPTVVTSPQSSTTVEFTSEGTTITSVFTESSSSVNPSTGSSSAYDGSTTFGSTPKELPRLQILPM
uniref:Uncharacterized protein n=1 Tax=Caenorhabditis japonica TaxID=281687 RepID=A0A8R1EMG0_CAEJA